MNKYKLKITQEDGMFVGYAFQGEQIIHKTNPCKDSITASRMLSTLIGKAQAPSPTIVPVHRPQSAINVPSQTFQGTSVAPSAPAPSQQGVRRCCGRG
jgi:hypothetical protein